jgi:hypothetical protein
VCGAQAEQPVHRGRELGDLFFTVAVLVSYAHARGDLHRVDIQRRRALDVSSTSPPSSSLVFIRPRASAKRTDELNAAVRLPYARALGGGHV